MIPVFREVIASFLELGRQGSRHGDDDEGLDGELNFKGEALHEQDVADDSEEEGTEGGVHHPPRASLIATPPTRTAAMASNRGRHRA